MNLSDIKNGQVFEFVNNETRLPLRGHEFLFPTNGRFIHLTTCAGVAPKVYHMESHREVIFASEIYYQPVVAITEFK